MTKEVLKLGEDFFNTYRSTDVSSEKKREAILKILKSIDTGTFLHTFVGTVNGTLF